MTEQVVSPVAHFGRVPEHLLFSGAAAHECVLYAALTTYDYAKTGECYPGREILRKRLGWTLRTLDRAFQLLEERGAIERVRKGRGNLNAILLLADESPDMAGHRMSRQNVAYESPKGEISPLIERESNERARIPRKATGPRRRRSVTEVPPSWTITDEQLAWARVETPALDVHVATQEWLTACKAKDFRYADWDAAWKNAMRRADRWHKPEAARTFL